MATYEVGVERSVLDDIRFGLESSNTSVVLAAMKQLADYLSSLSMGGAADAEKITVDELLDIVALSAKAYGEKLKWMGDVDTGEPVVSVSKMNSTGAALFSTGVGGVSVGLISDMLMHAIIRAFLNLLHDKGLGSLQFSTSYKSVLETILSLSLILGVPVPRQLFDAADMRIRETSELKFLSFFVSRSNEEYLKQLTSILISALGLRQLPSGGVEGVVVSAGTFFLRQMIAKQVALLFTVILQATNPFQNVAADKMSAVLQYLGSWFTQGKFASLKDKIKRAYMGTTGFEKFLGREKPPAQADSVNDEIPSPEDRL